MVPWPTEPPTTAPPPTTPSTLGLSGGTVALIIFGVPVGAMLVATFVIFIAAKISRRYAQWRVAEYILHAGFVLIKNTLNYVLDSWRKKAITTIEKKIKTLI